VIIDGRLGQKFFEKDLVNQIARIGSLEEGKSELMRETTYMLIDWLSQ
jgi:hypothetical protein